MTKRKPLPYHASQELEDAKALLLDARRTLSKVEGETISLPAQAAVVKALLRIEQADHCLTRIRKED